MNPITPATIDALKDTMYQQFIEHIPLGLAIIVLVGVLGWLGIKYLVPGALRGWIGNGGGLAVRGIIAEENGKQVEHIVDRVNTGITTAIEKHELSENTRWEAIVTRLDERMDDFDQRLRRVERKIENRNLRKSRTRG